MNYHNPNNRRGDPPVARDDPTFLGNLNHYGRPAGRPYGYHMKPMQRWMNQKKSLINHLQQQIIELNRLTEQVSTYLPQEWRDACQVVRFDTQEQLLVISTVEQSLLTPLRYLQHQLIAQLKKHKNFSMLQSIKCIYTPTHTASTPIRTVTQTKDAAKACQAAAAYCPPELKAALEKLGETLAATKKTT